MTETKPTPYRIAITGEFRRGKDTLANMIIEELKPKHTERLAFADALKGELAHMTWMHLQELGGKLPDATKTETWATARDWMSMHRDVNGVGWQWWGEFRRMFYGEDYWITHPLFQGEYRRAVHAGWHTLVTDMRHHNEAQWCKEHGFYLIRIEGPCQVKGELRDAKHPSEIHVPELDVHLDIKNVGGLDALREKVASALMPKLAQFFTQVVSRREAHHLSC